jgi:hypothetical protein
MSLFKPPDIKKLEEGRNVRKLVKALSYIGIAGSGTWKIESSKKPGTVKGPGYFSAGRNPMTSCEQILG